MSATIMVVDDSRSMRAIISDVIRSIGFNAVTAESGEQACEMFASQPADIVVLDVNMGGIDGFETCRRLRAIARNEWFPVIYLSANDSAEYIIEGLDAGGDAYVTKPIHPRVLESILRAMGRIVDMKAALDIANRKLERIAGYDGLTQILNRRSFDEALARLTRQAKRDGTELALLIVDIDYFKLFNDHYGHLHGDDCLRIIAGALSRSVYRPLDIVARYGGEEFGVLLPNTSRKGAELAASRIVDNIAQLSIDHAESPVSSFVTASVGIALLGSGEGTSNDLIDAADKAMYQAKNRGRNQYVFSE